MATSKRCSMCEKGADTYFCTGCEKYFCKKDFDNHRETLNKELYGYTEDGNALRENITKATEKKDIHSPLLLQIDEWENTTIENVKLSAQEARKHVTQILNSKYVKITSEFEKFSQELIKLKETEDYVETDLNRLKEAINQLDQDLKQLAESPTIELHMEESKKVAWNRLIYVVEKTVYPAKVQRQEPVMGEFIN
jgi:DNA repair exonuclease SbcCD ATPase subunit